MTQFIDEQEAVLDQSQRLNFMRWPILNQYVHQNPRIWGSYKAEVNNVRKFMTKRIQWMDKKLNFDASVLSVENTGAEAPSCRKIIRDGQLLIIRGDKVYTVTGNCR